MRSVTGAIAVSTKILWNDKKIFIYLIIGIPPTSFHLLCMPILVLMLFQCISSSCVYFTVHHRLGCNLMLFASSLLTDISKVPNDRFKALFVFDAILSDYFFLIGSAIYIVNKCFIEFDSSIDSWHFVGWFTLNSTQQTDTLSSLSNNKQQNVNWNSFAVSRQYTLHRNVSTFQSSSEK